MNPTGDPMDLTAERETAKLTRQLQAAMIRPLIAIALNPTTPPTTQNAALQLATTYDNDLTTAALTNAAQWALNAHPDGAEQALKRWAGQAD